ncbi:hypothetical protein CC80DRAFT_588871 [Byssothecium circinans]|uniref:Large ribosomal subunit protein mL67 n=1 Tax=Byssothecium circinans TaxID=147558 RepID=A0A6A5UBK9_9PLEO|nr:hypothetical protein CC80DRAFT_588871 [Byssothecium circinans]
MPRNLGRLKFRAPKPPRPLNLSRVRPGNQRAVEQEITNHVIRLSKPATALSLSVVTDPKWKKQPGSKTRKLKHKPYTLRDIVDPERKKKHGEVIYVFRNTKTNQVIYSLSEMLDNYHLDQLPFIGKHSKPPVLRPDEWIPHCVALFPTPAQGHQAFRALREYRKLHELSWDRTNPEYRQLSRAERMKKIMDQVANTSADLAAVLTTQETRARKMANRLRRHEEEVIEFMNEKWAEIDELANASLAKEKENKDNTKWLENQIKSLTAQMAMKHNQNPADQARLTKAKRSHESRLRKIHYAQRKAEQFKTMQADLLEKATLANAEGAKEKLQKLQDDIAVLESDPHAPSSTAENLAYDRTTLQTYKNELSALRASFAAKKQHDTRDHYIARSVLPPQLTKSPPEPFIMDVEIKWADLRDAEFAAGNWPDAVVQDVLPLKAVKESVSFLNQEEYEQAVDDEVKGVIGELEREAVRRAEEAEQELLAREVEAEEERKGVFGFLGRNPFKRAEA